MTYDDAAAMCVAHQLSEREQATYAAMLELLDRASSTASLNLFALLMHFVSDGMASQIAQAPLHAREGLLVTLTEDIAHSVCCLAKAKCIVTGDLQEDDG